MTPSIDLTTEIHNYLRNAGWAAQDPGAAGALWRRLPADGAQVADLKEADSSASLPTLAVPFAIRLGTAEWRGLTERLAAFEGRPTAAVAFQIEHFYIDVTRLRTANEFLPSSSIGLTTGVDLVSSAYRIFRASATTARRPRPHIARNFSRLGDQIVERARLGQTEQGSYILPILMPLSEAPKERTLWHAEPGVDRVAPEPPERRVTRTLAQALTAVNARIVKPAREPKQADMVPLVAAGASRELVLALAHVLREPGVSFLEASFRWATGATAPASVPERVNIPAEAKELLSKASLLLRTTRREPLQQISGPLVEVRHVSSEAGGSVVLQTVRHGRPVEIRVHLTLSQLDPTYEWMRTSRTIVVGGQVQFDPGKPLRIDQPVDIYPLDETFLPEG